jgi:EmrB/QacA subfamily drug resistance transporter
MSVPSEEVSAAEHRRIMWVLSALMLGIVLSSLDQTIVATALPTIAGDLHGLNHLSWVVTAYLLTLTISTPLWGKLGDLYGRKKLFQASIVIFLLGSIFAGLSQSMTQLIAFRAIQGIGGGGLMVGAQAIVGDVVSPRQRGRYMGYFGAAFGVTSVIGPLLGGFFTQNLSWRWVFYINLPIGAIALFVIATRLKIPTRRTDHSVDYLGTALLGAAVTCIILLTTWGGTTYAWGSGLIIGLAVASVVLIGAFIAVEARAEEPLIPLGLFANRVFSVGATVGFLVGFVMFGAVIYIPLYLQVVHGATPTSSGLQLLPLVLGMLCTYVPSGRLVARWGRYKVFPVMGTAIMSVGLLLLSTMNPSTSLLVSSLYMAVVGIGLGMVTQILVVAVQNAVPYDQLGTATSSATFFRSIGGAFGVALFGSILTWRLTVELPRYLSPIQLRSVSAKDLATSPAVLAKLPPAIHAGVVQAFSNSLDTVFLVGVPVGIAAFALTLFLEEVPLRDHGVPSDLGQAADLP